MDDVNQPEDKQMAAVALQFLRRVQLTGEEVDVYCALRLWLQRKAAAAVEPQA